jgi:MFS family permease
MPIPTIIENRRQVSQQNFSALYLAIIVFSFHWSIVLYINSSFLEQFFAEHTITLLYGIGSVISLALFMLAPRLLRHIGNYTAILYFGLLEVIALVGMAMSNTDIMALISFCIHASVTPLILYHIDIFMEAMTGSREQNTGSKRGLMLGIMALTMALAALLSGYLVDGGEPHFSVAYSASVLFLLPFFIILMRYFRTFSDPHYPPLALKANIIGFLHNTNLRGVFGVRFLLELFFTWMVIYTPLYLSTVIGFDWETIGTILFVCLLAYVFFEYAIGIIADRYIGEKEMMVAGLVVIAGFTIWCAFIKADPILWMIALFMTRVGASLVETTSESYFFKHTDGGDASTVSFFRMTRPLSYIAGSLCGVITLLLFPMNMVFIILGICMIPGIFLALTLIDTK